MSPVVARCPRCKEPTRLDAGNAYRPFCSERCKLLDFGAWVDELYTIPTESDEPSDVDGREERPLQ